MKPHASKLTAKALSAIRKAVRYVFQRKCVAIDRASEAKNGPFATFTEWGSEADEEAYRSL